MTPVSSVIGVSTPQYLRLIWFFSICNLTKAAFRQLHTCIPLKILPAPTFSLCLSVRLCLSICLCLSLSVTLSLSLTHTLTADIHTHVTNLKLPQAQLCNMLELYYIKSLTLCKEVVWKPEGEEGQGFASTQYVHPFNLLFFSILGVRCCASQDKVNLSCQLDLP